MIRNHKTGESHRVNNRYGGDMQIAITQDNIDRGIDNQIVTKAIADTGATDHLFKDRPSLQFCRKSQQIQG